MPIIGSLSTAVAASGLPLERGGSSVVGRGRAGRFFFFCGFTHFLQTHARSLPKYGSTTYFSFFPIYLSLGLVPFDDAY